MKSYLLRLLNSGEIRNTMVEPRPPSVDPTVAERVELFDEEPCVAHRSLFLAIALNCGGLGQREWVSSRISTSNHGSTTLPEDNKEQRQQNHRQTPTTTPPNNYECKHHLALQQVRNSTNFANSGNRKPVNRYGYHLTEHAYHTLTS